MKIMDVGNMGKQVKILEVNRKYIPSNIGLENKVK